MVLAEQKLEKDEDFERLFKVFDAHSIGYFFYNGGNDSMDTAYKIHRKAIEMNFPLRVVGVPKTVDNDLLLTDHCPGYGSAAKFTAISIREATRDLKSMYSDSTQGVHNGVDGPSCRMDGGIGALASIDSTSGTANNFTSGGWPSIPETFLRRIEEAYQNRMDTAP